MNHMTDMIIRFFIAAVREAARWPLPFRFEAREALYSMSADCFEDYIAMETN